MRLHQQDIFFPHSAWTDNTANARTHEAAGPGVRGSSFFSDLMRGGAGRLTQTDPCIIPSHHQMSPFPPPTKKVVFFWYVGGDRRLRPEHRTKTRPLARRVCWILHGNSKWKCRLPDRAIAAAKQAIIMSYGFFSLGRIKRREGGNWCGPRKGRA